MALIYVSMYMYISKFDTIIPCMKCMLCNMYKSRNVEHSSGDNVICNIFVYILKNKEPM